MKVIFLDCDGVLNRAGTWEHQPHVGGYTGLEPELIERLRALQARTGADVVLSSTWRLIPEMREAVRTLIPFQHQTPERGARGWDIASWLRDHSEVERYAIIDDDRDMLPEQLPSAFFTDIETGLTEEIVEAVVAHLGEHEDTGPG